MSGRNITINPRAYIQFSDQIKQFYYDETVKLAELHLKPSQARLLHFLSDYAGLNQQEASHIFGVSSSTMSEMLTGMEKENLIWREVNPDNKRMTFIRLTEKGTETAAHIRSLFDDYCLSFMKDFTDEEIKVFEKLMIKFNRS